MNFTRRAMALPQDFQTLLEIVRLHPERHTHVIDLPYRLSSWALDDPANSAIWLDESGRACAWAVLQTPFWSIDLAVSEAEALPGLYAAVLAWSDERALQLAETPLSHPAWFVNVFEDQAEEIEALEQAGFECQTNVPVDPWVKVQLWRVLAGAEADPAAAEGFSVRPLGGMAETGAYAALHRAAFGSSNMTDEWRRRTLAQPGYSADLDLVAQASDGRLAAFCIGWFHPWGIGSGPAAQVEPLGAHPDFQRRGLGRALLAEVFQRAARRGARRIYVECDDYPDGPAFALYRAAGFEIHRKIAIYRKNYGDSH